MQIRNKAIKILKDTTGSSFVLVIAAMMFLMAIGVSALVAASNNSTTILNQKEYSKAIILADSIQKNILYSLQYEYDPYDDEYLSYKLAKALYEANDPDSLSYDPNIKRLDDMEIEMELDSFALSDNNIKQPEIKFSFPIQKVFIKPEVDEVIDIDSNVQLFPREPKTATLDAKMDVTVKLNVNGKTLTSRATYEYIGGKLSDDPDGDGDAGDMDFMPNEYGEWRLLKYEKLDS